MECSLTRPEAAAAAAAAAQSVCIAELESCIYGKICTKILNTLLQKAERNL